MSELQIFTPGKVYKSDVSGGRWLCLADIEIPHGRLTFYITLPKHEIDTSQITDWHRLNTTGYRTRWDEE